jgi:ribonuclease HI
MIIHEFKSLLLNVDGGCEPKNPGGVATAGWVFFNPKKSTTPLEEQSAVVRDGGPLATNNFGEYKALILALNFLAKNNWRGELTVKADSKLLIEQVAGRWKVKAEHLKPLRSKIWQLMDDLQLERVDEHNPIASEGRYPCHLIWIKRELNGYANDLCRKAYQDYRQGKISLETLLDGV